MSDKEENETAATPELGPRPDVTSLVGLSALRVLRPAALLGRVLLPATLATLLRRVLLGLRRRVLLLALRGPALPAALLLRLLLALRPRARLLALRPARLLLAVRVPGRGRGLPAAGDEAQRVEGGQRERAEQ